MQLNGKDTKDIELENSISRSIFPLTLPNAEGGFATWNGIHN